MIYQKELKAPINIFLGLPLLLLTFGIYHGVLQVLYRAGIIRADSFLGIEYYQGLTGHGVINAIVLTTFFAIAFGFTTISNQLKTKVQMGWVWISLIILILGSVLVAGCIFLGVGSVLYTFYPPLKAHPLFYVGLGLFVVGSWIPLYTWAGAYWEWKNHHKGAKVPLPVVGIFSTFIIWQLCTLPVAFEVLFLLSPWSLGLTAEINVMLARTLFWFFGHPLVYFWLLPTYVMYYTVLPKVAGGKLYSDFAGRFVFLSFLVMSSPLGLHHQFADPGLSSKWKAMHTVLTSLVAIPSMMTAFTICASLEYAARRRGGKGLFGWWKALPYFDKERWLFPYLFCGLIIFIFGGATGIVNASFSVNNVVHNTSWIPAHFHLTVGGPVFLGILGMSLWILSGLNQKRTQFVGLALAVPYLWTGGLFIMSSAMFVSGLRGEPRRTNLGMTYLNPDSPLYRSDWASTAHVAVLGGCIMALAVVCYFMVLLKTLLASPQPSLAKNEMPFCEAYHNEDISLVNSFKPWIWAAIIAVIVAYAVPLENLYRSPIIPSGAYNPDNPVSVGH